MERGAGVGSVDVAPVERCGGPDDSRRSSTVSVDTNDR